MTDWAAFTGFTGLVLVVLLSFAYFSRGIPHGDDVSPGTPDDTDARVVTPDADDDPAAVADGPERRAAHTETPPRAGDADRERPVDTDRERPGADSETATDVEATQSVPSPVVPTRGGDAGTTDLPTHLLIANVAVSQAVLGGFLALGAWYAEIPLSALGLSVGDVPTKLGIGLALGLALYAVNRAGSSLSRQFGFAPDEALRESLTPESRTGWALLLLVALPLIAGFEELLFRGALVGALAVGFDVSPWFMASVSSVAFGAGHTAQGRLGIVVTGLLGFVLAAAFVVTGSLLVVVVAHYLVNALEFVGNELFGW